MNNMGFWKFFLWCTGVMLIWAIIQALLFAIGWAVLSAGNRTRVVSDDTRCPKCGKGHIVNGICNECGHTPTPH